MSATLNRGFMSVTTLDRREKMAPPTPEEAMMVRKAQVLIHYAIDLWMGELARQGRSEATRRKYQQVLDPFGDRHRDQSPREIVTDEIRAYLDQWVNASPSTLALHVTVFRRFFAFLEDEGIVPRSPADRLKRPPRKKPEDIEIVTITPADAGKLLEACGDWQERICIAVLAYTGVRRKAAANARRRDIDLDLGTIRFVEKGGKVIRKPIPDELLALLRHCDRELHQWRTGDDWLIPNRKPWLVKSRKERGHKLIYETVKRVADKAGIDCHPHAFRGAFAVAFDEAHPDQNRVLQDLMGHARPETTAVYLRRRNVAKQMEVVRDLSFGLPAYKQIPPAGFEPALQPNPHGDTDAAVADSATVADRLLEEAHNKAKAGEPARRVETDQDLAPGEPKKGSVT